MSLGEYRAFGNQQKEVVVAPFEPASSTEMGPAASNADYLFGAQDDPVAG